MWKCCGFHLQQITDADKWICCRLSVICRGFHHSQCSSRFTCGPGLQVYSYMPNCVQQVTANENTAGALWKIVLQFQDTRRLLLQTAIKNRVMLQKETRSVMLLCPPQGLNRALSIGHHITQALGRRISLIDGAPQNTIHNRLSVPSYCTHFCCVHQAFKKLVLGSEAPKCPEHNAK